MKSNFFLISPTCGILQLDSVDVVIAVALHAAAVEQLATFGSKSGIAFPKAVSPPAAALYFCSDPKFKIFRLLLMLIY